jgi:hypothetical protein
MEQGTQQGFNRELTPAARKSNFGCFTQREEPVAQLGFMRPRGLSADAARSRMSGEQTPEALMSEVQVLSPTNSTLAPIDLRVCRHISHLSSDMPIRRKSFVRKNV